MRAMIMAEMPALFSTVMDGFSVSTITIDKSLLKVSERHLFLLIRLTEWAESEKTLSACGIKNTMPSRGAKSDYKNVIPALDINDSIHHGMDIALQCYDRTVGELYQVINGDEFAFGDFERATKACLISLHHITSLCRIAEYTHRCGSVANDSGDSEQAETETNKRIKDMADVDWSKENGTSARVYFDGLNKYNAQYLVRKINQYDLCTAFADIYLGVRNEFTIGNHPYRQIKKTYIHDYTKTKPQEQTQQNEQQNAQTDSTVSP